MTREMEPDTDRVSYLDEYPELKKKVWLRRLNVQRGLGVISIAGDPADVIPFPGQETEDEGGPDGAA